MTPQLQPQVDDLRLLIDILPTRLAEYLKNSPELPNLIEIVMDLGRKPEVRFSNHIYRLKELGDFTEEDIDFVTKRIGEFNTDNRAGIERTLHRISAIRNRAGKVIGLTCRIGRAVQGTVEIIRDIVESGRNCLFLGPPGIGKTTILRETARVLAANKRVVVVDTSNEIAGDGDIPHPGIGDARRLHVPSPDKQHHTMIEAVENHMPEVIVVDEIGTEQETKAARTIAERGVQLVATAHGYNLENVVKNPVLSNLIGGVQSVVIGDEEAKFRGTSKSVLERKSLPTFDVVIEIQSRDVFAICSPVAAFVDGLLANDPMDPEIRVRDMDAIAEVPAKEVKENKEPEMPEPVERDLVSIFPFGIGVSALNAAIQALQAPAKVAKDVGGADIALTLKSKVGSKSKLGQILQGRNIPMHVIQSGSGITQFLRDHFKLPESDEDVIEDAIREAEKAAVVVESECRVVECQPHDTLIRKMQHQVAFDHGLNSMSVGEDPNRRVRIYPRG
jgi:stage III sporulation protein AA